MPLAVRSDATRIFILLVVKARIVFRLSDVRVVDVSVPMTDVNSGARRDRRRERRRALSFDLVKMRTLVGTAPPLLSAEPVLDTSSSDMDVPSSSDEDAGSSSEESSCFVGCGAPPFRSKSPPSNSTRYRGFCDSSRILMADSLRPSGRAYSVLLLGSTSSLPVPSRMTCRGLLSLRLFRRLRSVVMVALRTTLRTPLWNESSKFRVFVFATLSISITTSSHCWKLWPRRLSASSMINQRT